MKKQLELIDEYLYYGRKQRKLDEKTIRAYYIDLKQFSDYSGQKEVVMSRELIRQYILHLHASITTTQIYAEVASKKQMEILRRKHPRKYMKI